MRPQHGVSPESLVSHATTGSGPSASFLGSDMRAAYYGGTALTGAGQNLGLFEFLGTDLADLNTYYKNVGQTNKVPITLLSTDGTSTSCTDNRAGRDCDDTEQTLDMTQALGMAPGLASLVMYIGSTDTAIISAMTTHNPLPTTIGCSWGWTPADPTTLDPFFKKNGGAGPELLRGIRRRLHLVEAQRGVAGGRCQRRLRWRHRPRDQRRRRRVVFGNRLGRQRRRHLAGQDRDSCLPEARRA